MRLGVARKNHICTSAVVGRHGGQNYVCLRNANNLYSVDSTQVPFGNLFLFLIPYFWGNAFFYIVTYTRFDNNNIEIPEVERTACFYFLLVI